MNSDRLGSDMTERNAKIILEVAKAIGAHLELSDVLTALIPTLKPLVHFDAIGTGILEGETIRLHSSDRTIAEYAADIWRVKPCPVS
jgi:glucan phosphorylase